MSCSGNDYLKVLPRESVAMASVDLSQLASSEKESLSRSLRESQGIDDLYAAGIDLSSKVYAFEMPDGTLGFVAKVDDADVLTNTFVKLSDKGKCTKPEARRGNMFTMLGDAWLAGYSDDALIVIGPITVMQRKATEQIMQRMFAHDESQGASGSRIFHRLDSLDAPVALVAQTSALPEKVVLPFTIGMPKGADASQIVVSATMSKEDGIMVVRGNTFSFNKQIDKKLKENREVFQPVTDDMFGRLPSRGMGFLFMNADGEKLLNVLQQGKEFQALLAGANVAIDMDNIIRGIKGDMVLSLNDFNGSADFIARLGKRSFLDDVDYWKKSCPAGSTITDLGKDSYIYKGGDFSYSFAVTSDNLFISSLRHDEAKDVEDVALNMPDEISSKIKGSRLAMLMDLGKTGNQTVTSIVKPILGGTDKVLYIME